MSMVCPDLASRDALKQHLRRLYPHLKQRDAKRKFSRSVKEGEFAFFRAYVAYFYDLLRRKQGDIDFHGMDVIRGWCVGDAHPENFGVLFCRSSAPGNKFKFSMNDPDDGSPGPLYSDLLRFLTAVRLLGREVSLDPIINAYRQGLDGDTSLSPVVLKEMARAAHRPKRPERLFRVNSKDHLKPRKKYRKRFKFKKNVSKRKARRLTKGIVKLTGGDYRVCALWGLKKKGGGSGGVRRYWILLAPRGHGRIRAKSYDRRAVVLDLKRITRSGMYALQCPAEDPPQTLACSGEPKTMMNRVGETLDLERGMNVGRFCQPVRFKKMPPMLIRERCKGNRGIDLDAGYSSRELAQLLKDEARVLGNIHSKSLPQGNHYAGHVYALSSILVEASAQMEALFLRAFQLAKQKK